MAVKIENNSQVAYGRQFDYKDELVSHMTRYMRRRPAVIARLPAHPPALPSTC